MPSKCDHYENGVKCNRQPRWCFEGEKERYCGNHWKEGMIELYRRHECIISDCHIQPSYNIPGKPPIYCMAHAKQFCKENDLEFKIDVINVKDEKCQVFENGERCKTLANFNYWGQPPIYCEKHALKKERELGLVKGTILNVKRIKIPPNIMIPKQDISNEKKIVAEKKLAEKRGIKIDDYNDEKKDIKSLKKSLEKIKIINNPRKLLYKTGEIGAHCFGDCECESSAEYNYADFSTGFYCREHSSENMINVTYRKCQHLEEECFEDPLFNFQGSKYGIFCINHRKEGMINIKHRLCRFMDEHGRMCPQSPSYNYSTETGPKFCELHRKKDMIITYKRKCKVNDCDNRASYNFPGETEYLYCNDHYEKGMINLEFKNSLCKHEGGICLKRAIFNKSGETKGFYCFDHKHKGMENISKDKCGVEISNGETCKKRPCYNYRGKFRGKYCTGHKLNGMINVCDKTCIFTDHNGIRCETIPYFNYKGEKYAQYCETHKDEDMINIKDRKCNSDFCDIIANKKYDYYCCHCFTNLFPSDPRTFTAMKASKELEVKKYLYENDYEFIHNKPIYTGDCITRRRIDLYNRVDDEHILCIEIDEKQHMYYDSIDEEKRYNELYPLTKNGNNPVLIFIRYNPDSYIDVNGVRRRPRFKTRMKYLTGLIERIEHDIKHTDEYNADKGLIYIHKMYYNEQ